MRLQPLDIVRTSYGTVCVVNEVASDGDVSLVLPKNSSQKYAWYSPSELVFVARTADLVAATPGLTQQRPKREALRLPKHLNVLVDILNRT